MDVPPRGTPDPLGTPHRWWWTPPQKTSKLLLQNFNKKKTKPANDNKRNIGINEIIIILFGKN